MGVEIFLSYTWSKEPDNEIRKFWDKLERSLLDASGKKGVSIFYDKANIRKW